ncbi:hypothetical protein ABZ477_00215 [Microbacterium sp. NPDC019599]|uniref:hypothetical protein n=1 Tax=Microbacterium sp. NPDC019599 TaxID=3154690 RepID=UPI0033F7603C
MVRTWEDGAVAVETCPVCASLEVRTIEPDWFAVELERSAEVRAQDVGFEIEFACRECGAVWR